MQSTLATAYQDSFPEPKPGGEDALEFPVYVMNTAVLPSTLLQNLRYIQSAVDNRFKRGYCAAANLRLRILRFISFVEPHTSVVKADDFMWKKRYGVG